MSLLSWLKDTFGSRLDSAVDIDVTDEAKVLRNFSSCLDQLTKISGMPPIRPTERSKTTLDFGQTKQALLDYDYVVPLALTPDQFEHSDTVWNVLAASPPSLLNRKEYTIYIQYLAATMLCAQALREPESIEIFELASRVSSITIALRLQEMLGDRRDYGLMLPADFLERTGSADQKLLPVATLSNLGFVDIQKVSWDRVFELRQDEKSMRRFRRLHKFLSSQSEARTPADLKRELQLAIDDYQEQSERLGLEYNYSKALSMIFGEGSFRNFILVSGGLISLNTSSITPAAGAAALSLGGVLIELHHKRLKANKELEQNPVAFVYDLA